VSNKSPSNDLQLHRYSLVLTMTPPPFGPYLNTTSRRPCWSRLSWGWEMKGQRLFAAPLTQTSARPAESSPAAGNGGRTDGLKPCLGSCQDETRARTCSCAQRMWLRVLEKLKRNPAVRCNAGREPGSCGAASLSLPITLTQEELPFPHRNLHEPKNPPGTYVPCAGQWSRQPGQ